MVIKTGLSLLCFFNFYGIGSYKVRIHDVPTKVLWTNGKQALLDYDLKSIENFTVLADGPYQEIVDTADITSDYLKCKAAN